MEKILVTGASGFLGSSILDNWPGLDTKLTLGRTNSDFNCDLSKNPPTFTFPFDIVIHAAGKAHLAPRTESERADFFDVNVKGIRNLLSGLSSVGLPKSLVFISTVAVYGKREGTLISEGTALNATDPYGLSKIQAENLLQEWCARHNVVCSILRLPLIAGYKPPGNLGIMIDAIAKGYYFNISGGEAKKSVVLAEDIAKILPTAAKVGGIHNLTDGYHPSFSELSQLIAMQLGKKKPLSIPSWLAKLLAVAGDMLGSKAPFNTDKLGKLTSDLTFDDSKAREMLGWNPTPVLERFKIG